jgi:hypothetical protein
LHDGRNVNSLKQRHTDILETSILYSVTRLILVYLKGLVQASWFGLMLDSFGVQKWIVN